MEGIYKDKTTRKTVEQQEQEAVEKEEGEEPELKIWNRALFRLIKKTQSGKLISSAFLTWDFDSGKEHDMYEIED